MIESIELIQNALKKMEEARVEIERDVTARDRTAANADSIFNEMCAANLKHTQTAESIRELTLASLLYSHAILSHHMAAQATMQQV